MGEQILDVNPVRFGPVPLAVTTGGFDYSPVLIADVTATYAQKNQFVVTLQTTIIFPQPAAAIQVISGPDIGAARITAPLMVHFDGIECTATAANFADAVGLRYTWKTGLRLLQQGLNPVVSFAYDYSVPPELSSPAPYVDPVDERFALTVTVTDQHGVESVTSTTYIELPKAVAHITYTIADAGGGRKHVECGAAAAGMYGQLTYACGFISMAGAQVINQGNQSSAIFSFDFLPGVFDPWEQQPLTVGVLVTDEVGRGAADIAQVLSSS